MRIDAHTLDSATAWILGRRPGAPGRAVHLCNAYTLSLATPDSAVKRSLESGALNLPDGMPLVWIARRLGIALPGRVYGPDLMLSAMRAGVVSQTRHYLHGGSEEVLGLVSRELRRTIPGVAIVGMDAPPFRSPTVDEEKVLVERIDRLGVDVVWVALGTPKQDLAIERLARLSDATFVGVGAAFDFIAGAKPQAPTWIQNRGLEWAYRLYSEPSRLWRRYLIGNTKFVFEVLRRRPRLLPSP